MENFNFLVIFNNYYSKELGNVVFQLIEWVTELIHTHTHKINIWDQEYLGNEIHNYIQETILLQST